MKQILFQISITALLFFGFLFFIIAGYRKNNSQARIAALLILLFTIISGTWTGYTIARKSYNKARQAVRGIDIDVLKPRTGIEIYTSIFGAPAYPCVDVVNRMDQIIPKLDCCIWLEFNTCPEELKRIIALADYKEKVYSVADSNLVIPNYSPRPGWWRPSLPGSKMIVLDDLKPDEPNKNRILIFGADSTHVFYCDMLD